MSKRKNTAKHVGRSRDTIAHPRTPPGPSVPAVIAAPSPPSVDSDRDVAMATVSQSDVKVRPEPMQSRPVSIVFNDGLPNRPSSAGPSGQSGASRERRNRDQDRALCAYEAAQKLEESGHEDFKRAAQTFGGTVMRLGLSAALAVLERDQARPGVKAYLVALANAEPPGWKKGNDTKGFPAWVRNLGASDYMLVTRELLKSATWLKRAAEATFVEERTSADCPA